MTKTNTEKQSCCGGKDKSVTEQLAATPQVASTCCQAKHGQSRKETATVATGCCGGKKH
ncbi:MAG: hypothetical protein COA60_003165 [Robiginitomaculum sp.]|nr:hypothetical protein [Robiginitomaculum sp.]